MGKRARYWGESKNRSSNATFLGVGACRGETLPPFEEGADTPAEVFIGDMEVIVCIWESLMSIVDDAMGREWLWEYWLGMSVRVLPV